MRRLAAAALCLALLLPVSATAADRVLLTPPAGTAGDELQTLAAASARDGKVSIIVGLRVPFAPEGELTAAEAQAQRAEIAAAAAQLRSRLPGTLGGAPRSFHAYDAIPFAVLDVTGPELARLAEDAAVLSIRGNPTLTPQLSKSARLVNAPAAWSAGASGEGQVIAIIDTGIDKSHSFLSGKVVSEACYLQNAQDDTHEGACRGGSSTAPGAGLPCPLGSICSHGTHVAGIVAGLGTTTSGVARNARLISINIFGGGSGAASSDMIRGLERVLELRHSFPIAAVNLSFTGEPFEGPCDWSDPAATAAIENLRSAGIATIVASGNDGATNAIAFPGCISSAVSVGSVYAQASGDCGGRAADQLACTSNSAPGLSLLAPGAPISSSVPGNRFARMSGTSMAAAHVSGAWAVLKQRSPAASVTAVLQTLQDTGKTITDVRTVPTRATKRIDVKAALDQIGQTPGVSLVIAGKGRGTVNFTQGASSTSCNSSCKRDFAAGTRVRLEAVPSSTSLFTGWSGACSNMDVCEIDIAAARLVRANFDQRPDVPINVAMDGVGFVSFSFTESGTVQYYDCVTSCSAYVLRGTDVSLTAIDSDFMVFTGWLGACRGQGRTCTVRMSDARSATARFVPYHGFSYYAGGTGSGTVTLATGGNSTTCIEYCEDRYPQGTVFRLTATANPGSVFVGWTGACSGRFSSCTVTLRDSRFVSAIFNRSAAASAATAP